MTTPTVKILRHDTLEELEVPVSALRWFPYSAPERQGEAAGVYGWKVKFGASRADRRERADVPFLRVEPDSHFVVRVTITRSASSCRRGKAPAGWGREEAKLVRAAKLAQRRLLEAIRAEAQIEATRRLLEAGL